MLQICFLALAVPSHDDWPMIGSIFRLVKACLSRGSNSSVPGEGCAGRTAGSFETFADSQDCVNTAYRRAPPSVRVAASGLTQDAGKLSLRSQQDRAGELRLLLSFSAYTPEPTSPVDRPACRVFAPPDSILSGFGPSSSRFDGLLRRRMSIEDALIPPSLTRASRAPVTEREQRSPSQKIT